MRRVIIILFLAVLGISSAAQGIKYVTGTIYNKSTKKPIDVGSVEVEIYAYNTVATARDQKAELESADFNEVVIAADYIGTIDRNGYYMVNVASTGAILYKIGIGNTVLMEEVNNRLSIDVYTVVDNYLQAAVTSAERIEVGALDPQSDIEGNYLYVTSPYSIPSNTSKTNVRMILQPILLFADTKDTIQYLKPQVIDGEEFSKNQIRKMGFNEKNDKLHRYILKDSHLSKESQTFVWSDSVYVEDPMKNFLVIGCFQFEDYNKVYKYTEQPISSMRPRRPTRFLRIDIDPYIINSDDYPEYPKRERFNVENDISIIFNVGKSTFDTQDKTTVESLADLKQQLLEVINGEGSILKEFHISCVASPDGDYGHNVELAKKRMATAISTIQSYIPHKLRERVYWTTDSRVAGWDEVADMLEKDGKSEIAAQIRKVISDYPKDQGMQSRKIQVLPVYRQVIIDYLPTLRNVHYSYTQEIFRNPTAEEILKRYQTDEDLRSGKKKMTLYEYWMLFKMIDDPDELENLYIQANEAHKEINGKNWILPSNGLAVLDIQKGIVDTTLLNPFIDYSVRNTDIRINRSYGVEIINPESVIANQMIMYMSARNFSQASRLSQILKDNDKNTLLKNYSMCLGGYYKGGKTPEEIKQAQAVFRTIEGTSPFNKVVINLAMKIRRNDIIAENTMPECEAAATTTYDKALVQYFWAILYQRKFLATNDIVSDMERQDRLMECFRIDPSFIDIAAADGDIDQQIFQAARDLYMIQL